MIEGIFKFLNIQEIWESIFLQVTLALNSIRFQFLEIMVPFWDKVLNNPMASIITLLALIGLPYTLIKAKDSSTQANDRLDQLMDEMDDFEFEKPLIDLQEKLKDTSNDDSSLSDYDQDFPNLSLEIDAADLKTEEGSGPRNLNSESFAKHLSLDQEVTDNFLTANSWDLHQKTNDEDPELLTLSEEDSATENSEETKISPPGEPHSMEEEYTNLFFEDLPQNDEANDLVASLEENHDVAKDSLPKPLDEEQEIASQDEDDLQTRMEQTIKKLKMKYSPLEETEEAVFGKTSTDPVPSVSETAENPSSHEEIKEDVIENASPPSSATLSQDENVSPASLVSPTSAGGQEESLDKSDVITHLKSFQKNLESRFDSRANGLKKNSIDSPQEQKAFFRPIPKSSNTTWPAPDKTTDNEYQESLESFIFSKGQKKPE